MRFLQNLKKGGKKEEKNRKGADASFPDLRHCLVLQVGPGSLSNNWSVYVSPLMNYEHS